MPSYKLYDCNTRSNAEVVRMLFAYAGVDFEDIRLAEDEWHATRDEMSFKRTPVLDIDGKRLGQLFAIVRYLAREFNLCGKSSFQTARADEFAESIHEIMLLFPWTEMNDDNRETMMLKTLRVAVGPALLDLEDDVEGEKYYGDQLTYADLAFAVAAEVLLEFSSEVLDATPKLKALYNNVIAIPRVAKWFQEKPRTPF